MYIYIYISTYVNSPHGCTLLDPKIVQCLLWYEIVKCGLIVADFCGIILCLVNM